MHWQLIVRIYNYCSVVFFDPRPLRPIHIIYEFIQVYQCERSAILGGEKRLNGDVEGRVYNVNGFWYLTKKLSGGGKMSPLYTALFRTGQSERSTLPLYPNSQNSFTIRIDGVIIHCSIYALKHSQYFKCILYFDFRKILSYYVFDNYRLN